jgi:hypothetical protein
MQDVEEHSDVQKRPPTANKEEDLKDDEKNQDSNYEESEKGDVTSEQSKSNFIISHTDFWFTINDLDLSQKDHFDSEKDLTKEKR